MAVSHVTIITQLSTVLICLCLFLSVPAKSQSKGEIYGQLRIDKSWNRTVYLSYIPSMNAMHTMTSDMIIDESKADSKGSFHFKTSYLPKQDGLYRIHLTKKGDPPGSLMIGGKDENHIFFIANAATQIYIHGVDSTALFEQVSVSGHPANTSFAKITELANYADSTGTQSHIKRQFVRKAVQEQLRHVADTCTRPLLAIYALHLSNAEANYPVNQQFYDDFLEKWKAENSTYFEAFKKQFPEKEKINNPINLWPLIFLPMAFALGYWLALKRRPIQEKQQQNPVSALSVQERRIFAMLQQGKTNKDISEELNIGVNTVKSHVSKIYSKLKIKSRKEAMDIRG